jgi:hypothetical protein
VWSEYHADFDIYGNVDLVIGIGEEQHPQAEQVIPSIISGQLNLEETEKYRVYDISGREVDPHKLRPGVYFIEKENRKVQKVVKVR